MPSAFDRLIVRAQQLEKATGPSGPLAALYDYFGAAEVLTHEEGVHRRVGRRLAAAVRPMLSAAWDRSGLDKNSKTGHGKLYHEATAGAEIFVSEKGLRVQLAAGLDPKIYAWAGALLFGAVHGPLEARTPQKYQFNPTGPLAFLNDTRTTRSVLGAAAKRSFKKSVFSGKPLSNRSRMRIENPTIRHVPETMQGKLGKTIEIRRGVGLHELKVRAKHDFWVFSGADVDTIVALHFQFTMEEISRAISTHKALVGRVKKSA